MVAFCNTESAWNLNYCRCPKTWHWGIRISDTFTQTSDKSCYLELIIKRARLSKTYKIGTVPTCQKTEQAWISDTYLFQTLIIYSYSNFRHFSVLSEIGSHSFEFPTTPSVSENQTHKNLEFRHLLIHIGIYFG